MSYAPLPERDYIRILTVQPSSNIDPRNSVRCSLEVVRLDATAQYTALSYCWGRDGDDDGTSSTQTIFINGTRKCVTRNLFDGLCRLRQTDRPLRIWIDALCIDQSNFAERSAQVAQMGKIFSLATIVHVWLGEGKTPQEDANTHSLIQCFAAGPHHLPTRDHGWTDGSGSDLQFCALRGNLDDIRTEWKEEPRAPRARPSIMDAARVLDSLLSRRYFKRRWVVQELYSAHRSKAPIHIGWGPYTAPCSTLSAFLEELHWHIERTFGVDLDPIRPSLQARFYTVRTMLLPTYINFHLEATLAFCSTLECSDPRDRIYSLLSLEKEFDMVPDYTATVAQAYSRFAKRMIERGFILGVLDNVLWNKRDQEAGLGLVDLGLPTWVPDLRMQFREPAGNRPAPQLQPVVIEEYILQINLLYVGIIGQVSEASILRKSLLCPQEDSLPNDPILDHLRGGLENRLWDRRFKSKKPLLALPREDTIDFASLSASLGGPSPKLSLLRRGDLVCKFDAQHFRPATLVLRESFTIAGIWSIVTTFSADVDARYQAFVEGKQFLSPSKKRARRRYVRVNIS